MKTLPLTNIDKFEKKEFIYQRPPNCEIFWYGHNTWNYQLKNFQAEGIVIKWKDNPFELDFYRDNYVLEK